MPTPSNLQVARWRVLNRTAPDLLNHLCLQRGLDPTNLVPDFTAHLHDPYLLPDMEKAVDLVVEAKVEQWPVVIFGDYDADGTPASALLSMVMERLGIEHQVLLPTRSEGYGLRPETIAKLPASTKLLITVDTGISSVEEVALAQKRGMKVIILDHHLPKSLKDGGLPPAEAVVDPFVAHSQYPFAHLCGCALAYKLTEALANKFPVELNEAFRKWLLDLVAISTVADMMPISGENRVLVHYGLQVLRKTRRPGLQAMLSAAGLTPDKLTTSSLGFTIGPRLNASGRLDDNRPAFDLLMSRNSTEAAELASIIENNNRERQAIVERVMAEAEKELFKQNSRTDRCFVIVGSNWPAGVLGLVAGKLTGNYLRPSIVLSGEKQLSGSSRSTDRYSIIDGLTAQEKLLSRYGGHRQAAGLSLPKENLSKFVDGIKAHAEQNLTELDLVPTYTADSILEPNEASLAVAEKINQLGPFGYSNAAPLFLLRDITLGSGRLLGASGDHSKWRARVGGNQIDAIGFGMGKRPQPEGPVDLLAYLESNQWQGRVSLQLRLVDFRPAGGEVEFVDAQK